MPKIKSSVTLSGRHLVKLSAARFDGEPALQSQPCSHGTACTQLKSPLREFGSTGGRGELAAFSAEFPCFCSAFEAEGAKPRELAGNQPLPSRPVPGRDLGSPGQRGRHSSPPGEGLVLPPAPALGAQPLQQHCNTRLAKTPGERAPRPPSCSHTL